MQTLVKYITTKNFFFNSNLQNPCFEFLFLFSKMLNLI